MTAPYGKHPEPDHGPPAPVGPSTAEDAMPAVLELGPGWPVWTLRLALSVVAVGAVLPLFGINVAAFVFLVVIAALAAGLPSSPAPALLIGAVAVAVTAAGADPLRPAVLVEIPLLHLVHVLAGITALVPTRAVVRPSALLRPARRFVVVQLVVFAVTGLAEILPTGRDTTVVELAGLVAASGLVALAIFALTREKKRDRQ